MNLKELDFYYFCTADIDILREKYFLLIKEILGVENFFNNFKLSEDERLDKNEKMQKQIRDFLLEDKELEKLFFSAYHTTSEIVLGDLLLQSLVADEVIKSKKNINIFLDKRSILYFEKIYPPNISIYKNKERSGSLLEYAEFMENLISEVQELKKVIVKPEKENV